MLFFNYLQTPRKNPATLTEGSFCQKTLKKENCIHSAHHGEEEAQHHEQIVVPGERHSHPEHKLTEAGEPHDLHTTNPAAMAAEREENQR